MLNIQYWSEEALGYVFMEDFGQTDPTKGFCSQTEISVQGTSYSGLGGTLSTNRLMILCPGSFTGTRLRQETPSCIPASLYGTTTKPSAAGAQRLMAIVPEVSTFFHELIHLVEGNGNTSPAGGEEYNVKAMLGPTFTKAQALANPETYTMVAYAITLSHPVPVEQFRCLMRKRAGSVTTILSTLLQSMGIRSNTTLDIVLGMMESPRHDTHTEVSIDGRG